MKVIARPFLPPRPPDAPPEPALSQPGVLEAVANAAGLAPARTFDSTWAYEYADEETLRTALAAVAGLADIVGAEREEVLKDAIAVGCGPYRTHDGGYRLENEFHFLLAHA